jgi:hypothetical protein
LAGRFWCSSIRRQRPAWNRPKSPPNSKANYGEAFFDSIDPTETSAAPRSSWPTNMERVLADIDPDHGDRGIGCLRHGVLLVLAPLAAYRWRGRSTAGPSH